MSAICLVYYLIKLSVKKIEFEEIEFVSAECDNVLPLIQNLHQLHPYVVFVEVFLLYQLVGVILKG